MTVKAAQLDPVAAGIALEAPGAAADHGASGIEVLAAGIHQPRRDDENRIQVMRQGGVGRSGAKSYRECVGRFGGNDGAGKAGELTVGELACTLDRGQYILGHQRRAVMEFHIRAQLEFPGAGIDRAPAAGQAGDQPGVVIDMGQRLEHMPADLVVGRNIRQMRIDRGDVGGHADAQGAAGVVPSFSCVPCVLGQHRQAERKQAGEQAAEQTGRKAMETRQQQSAGLQPRLIQITMGFHAAIVAPVLLRSCLGPASALPGPDSVGLLLQHLPVEIFQRARELGIVGQWRLQ